jgi:hypothetical protein
MDILRGGWAPGLLGNGAGLRADSPSTGGYSSEAEAIFAAFTTPPTTGRKDLIDAAVVALKTAGVWTKLDALCVFAAADSQAAKINWVQPGTYNATEVNAPAFAADTGFTGASTKYLSSGFNPSTAPGPKYTVNSASFFGWSLTNSVQNAGMIGGAGSAGFSIYPSYSGNHYWNLNHVAGFSNVAVTSGDGLLAATRIDASNTKFYRNGTNLSTFAEAADGAVFNDTILFLAKTGAYWIGTIAAAGIGATLSAADNTALYNALRTYMTGVGVP